MLLWLATAGAAPPPLPPARVLDAADLLTPADEGALAAEVGAVDGLAVVTVPAAPDPAALADTLLATWFPAGDGLVILLAARERRLVARVGPARAAPDERALAVAVQDVVVPRLVDGDVAGALRAGVAWVGGADDGPSPAWAAIGLGLAVAAVVAGREARA